MAVHPSRYRIRGVAVALGLCGFLLVCAFGCRGAPPTAFVQAEAGLSDGEAGARDARAGSIYDSGDGSSRFDAFEGSAESGPDAAGGEEHVDGSTQDATVEGGCSNRATDPENCGWCGHPCQGGSCDGGLCEPIVIASPVAYPNSIAVSGSSVYWTQVSDSTNNYANGAVMETALDGGVPASTPAIVAKNQLAPVDVTPTSEGVFWINGGLGGPTPDGGLMWLADGSSTPTPVASSFACPVALTSTDTDLYWVDCARSSNNQNQPLLTVPLGDPNSVPNALVSTGIGCMQAMTAAGSALYWLQTGCFATAGQVFSLDPTSVGAQPVDLLPSTTLSGGYPIRIAVSSSGVYFGYNPTGQLGAGMIAQAPLTAGMPTTVVPIANANGIAVDATNVYWTDFVQGAVLAAPLDGGVVVTLATGQSNPYDITIDDTNVYWTDNTSSGAVMKVAKP